jgi:TolB-like protein
MDRAVVRLEVLGPTRASLGGCELEVGGAKQRAVLTVLVAHGGAVAPTGRLLQEVWGEDVEPERKRSLQTYISNLRTIIDPERSGLIAAGPAGYHLSVGPRLALDILEVEAVRSSRDVGALLAALGRWRGEPLGALDGPWASQAREQLALLRGALAKQLAEAALAAGTPEVAIAPLAEVLHDQPLNEPLWRRHVELILQSGRNAEALLALGAFGRVLEEELGLELPDDLVRLASELRAGTTERRPRPVRELGRVSVAVLPFRAQESAGQRRIADGLVDDLLVELCRFRELFVIASRSTAHLREPTVDPLQVADELDVRYLVGGSLTWTDDRARVTVQLTDGLTGEQLWSHRYDERRGELFTSRDAIVRDLIAHLSGYHGRIVLAEKRRSRAATSDSAYLVYLQGLDLKHRFQPDTNLAARATLLRALEAEPRFARAQIAVGWTWLFEVIWGWTATPARSLAEARSCAEAAVALDELDAEVHWLWGEIHHAERQDELAVTAYRRAMALNPNLADVRANWAATANRIGRVDEALASMELAVQLNPNRPPWYDQFAGGVLYNARRYVAAVDTLRSVSLHSPVSGLYLAAALERSRSRTAARRQVATALEQLPGLDAALVARIEPYRDRDDQAHLIDPLVAAGLPT